MGSGGLAADYTLRISRLTIDKLGVKLYDRVSAVVAELLANCYDADATRVDVCAPLATLLSVPPAAGQWTVTVTDNGHGLTPDEAQAFYLRVGSDRRLPGGAGAQSRQLKRPVMGRKGIGKLAPFGICRVIEVLSSGGPQTQSGYRTSHFILDFDKITSSDIDDPVILERGDQDGTYRAQHGTTVTMRDFLSKRVPDSDVFMRQLERRFALADPSFEVVVHDARANGTPACRMAKFSIDVVSATQIDLSTRPVMLADGTSRHVSGWVAMAREAYKNEEMVGVRIYARGKIVATTRDFEQPAGYTGEHTARSYMVGEVHADWLDDDSGEDLIRTDRQSILWESDLGAALRAWGAEITKEIGRKSRGPRQAIVKKKFRELSDLEAKARVRFADEEVVRVALELGDQIGAFAAEDELDDVEYVEGLVEVILSVAPHRALIGAFQDFERSRTGSDTPTLESLVDLFGKTRVAEAASYAQIAAARVRVLDELDDIVFDSESDEAALQRIITDAPWLIQPDWTVITANQTLRTFKSTFEAYLLREHNESVELAIEHGTKRPDFVLTAIGGKLHLVEIKASGHALNDDDFERLYRYVEFLKKFFESNAQIRLEFPRGWRIDLVADSVNLKNPINDRAYAETLRSEEILRLSWNDFQVRARKTNEAFLDARDAARALASSAGSEPASAPPGSHVPSEPPVSLKVGGRAIPSPADVAQRSGR